MTDGGVEVGDLLAGVGHHQAARGAEFGEGDGAFGLGSVEHDLAPRMECVEHAAGVLAGSHPEADRGVVRS